MNNKLAYANLGFLDFMAYYVPGVIVIICLSIIEFLYRVDSKLNLNLNGLGLYSDGKNDFILGAVWAVLLLIIPYVLGHLFFPLGYFAEKVFKIKEKKRERKGSCMYSEQGIYCKFESRDFTRCLYNCLTSNTPFNEFMITRYRTLSRFCRAMLLPVFILGVLTFILGIQLMDVLVGFLGIGIAFSAIGLGIRYRKYERRWRNGVCVGAHP